MNISNHLKFFGLKKDFSEEDLKHSYRKMCKIFHPDCGGSEESFKSLVNMHNDLSNYLRSSNKEKEFSLDNYVDCHLCKISDFNSKFCYSCNGNGRVRNLNKRHNGIVISISEECKKCNGLGKIITPCKLCKGKLKVTRREYEEYILGFNI